MESLTKVYGIVHSNTKIVRSNLAYIKTIFSKKDGVLSFPIMVNGKSQRISVKTLVSTHQIEQLQHKKGILRITNNVSTIRLEQLANIRNTAETSRKNEKIDN